MKNIAKGNIRELLNSAVFILFICVFFALNIIFPAPTVLIAERRIPAKFPDITLDSLISGSFMSRFEDYVADNFVFRDAFRAVHSLMVFDIFRLKDASGLYRNNNIGLGEFRRIDTSAFRQSAQKINATAQHLSAFDLNIYYSLIPDKSIYADHYLPGFDLELAESILFDVLAEYDYIRLANLLDAPQYYKTDLHWDQSKIIYIADYIASFMGSGGVANDYPVATAGAFDGYYVGQYALPIGNDTMSYADISGLNIIYLSEKTLEFESGPLYDVERFEGIDPYDFFLRGPQPLIILENNAAPERELYLFRDSFGSSLAPLLTDSYSKIFLIDLRYINFMLLEMFIEFTPGSDVLFIYGSQIWNNPSVLQTS
jgi:hypothetical protein